MGIAACGRRFPRSLSASFFVFLTLIWGAASGNAASWTSLTNASPFIPGAMVLLSDGTVLVQVNGTQSWMQLVPDANGSYANGTWNQLIGTMSTPRLFHTSNVLQNGKLWVLGGQYSGPGVAQNWSGTGEIYDPVANTWSATAPYPDGVCPAVTQFGGNLTTGSAVVTGLLSTAGFQPGWTVTGQGIPAATTVLSVDSATQITLSQNASSSGASLLTFTLAAPLATVTLGSAQIAVNIVPSLLPGFIVSGAGIPDGATIVSLDSSTLFTISQPATTNSPGGGEPLTFTVALRPTSCFGSGPSMLLPNGQILAGSVGSSSTYLYSVANNMWTQTGNLNLDNSNGAGWVKLPDGSVLTYDIAQSIQASNGIAEKYDPVAGTWSVSAPGINSTGTFPLMSTTAINNEMGPMLLLQDGRALILGGTGATAIYNSTTNAWAAGPNIIGALNGNNSFLFSADHSPGAVLPNGHVVFAADAGLGVPTTGTTALASAVITAIPSTTGFQVGWSVSGDGIPPGATILTVDSATQVTLTAPATAAATLVPLVFGAPFFSGSTTATGGPTQLFDLDPNGNSGAGTIAALAVAPPDTATLATSPASATRMLMLPNGQLLFSDATEQLYLYTPDAPVSAPPQPTVSQVSATGTGTFTLTGTQLTGLNAGATTGDNTGGDENYPIVSLVNGTNNIFYAKTTNWSSVGVATGNTVQTVNFSLNPLPPLGNYSLLVSAAGISSAATPFSLVPDLTITKTHIGNFAQGQTGATYTITVTNLGLASTNATVTVADAIPAGLTLTAMTGTNWICAANSCSRSDFLAPAGSFEPITITVSVAAGAGANVTNSAMVAGGGEANTANDTAADITTVTPVAATLTANAGTTPQSAVVSTGFTNPLAVTVKDGGNNPVVGANVVFTAPASGASGIFSNSTNTITVPTDVSGVSSAPFTANATVGGPYNVSAVLGLLSTNFSLTNGAVVVPDLTLTSTHVGNFFRGETGATYTLTVTNGGTAATTGTVTVTNTLPTGLTAMAISGTDWTCTTPGGPCTSTDVIAPSGTYPPITLTVTVAADAAASITNNATVSGGGESNTANDSASDITTVTLKAASKAGILRSGASVFLNTQDLNGNVAWDPGVDLVGSFGIPGDVMIFGDWDGSGTTKIGIYRPSAALFALDMNGNGQWDPGTDVVGNFGIVGDTPIVGDWTGDGRSKIGIYRASNGQFALDINGNLAWDAGTDKTGIFGSPNGTPVVGDWTGTGVYRIGIFRNGHWVLDANGNLVIDAGTDLDGFIGTTGDTPIVGDWNGDGRTKVGIYRPTNSEFGLDFNGNLVWDNGVDLAGIYGQVGDVPIVGDWTGSGVTRVGIFRGGYWALDSNGNIGWDSGTDAVGFFGIAGDAPIVGKWQ